MKKKEEDELVFGQRGFDAPRKEVTIEDFGSEPAPKTKRQKFDDKFVRGERGKLLRRGSPTAQRAENKEAARNRAKKAALKRKGK